MRLTRLQKDVLRLMRENGGRAVFYTSYNKWSPNIYCFHGSYPVSYRTLNSLRKRGLIEVKTKFTHRQLWWAK